MNRNIQRLDLTSQVNAISGVDLLLQNGVTLLGNISKVFNGHAKRLLPCAEITQKWTFNSSEYRNIYKNIRPYNNMLSSQDRKSLILHDPTIQPLIFIAQNNISNEGILTNTSIFRESTGKMSPLETVKYHPTVSALHFSMPLGDAATGKNLLHKFCKDFLDGVMCPSSLVENSRDISHYADWSLSAKAETKDGKLEVMAGYQLSAEFSKILGQKDTAFFEVSISSRLAAALISYYGSHSAKLIFPSILAPIAMNIVAASDRLEEAYDFIENQNYLIDVSETKKFGTHPYKKAEKLYRHNGAPLTLLLLQEKQVVQLNATHNRYPIKKPNNFGIDKYLKKSDTEIERRYKEKEIFTPK